MALVSVSWEAPKTPCQSRLLPRLSGLATLLAPSLACPDVILLSLVRVLFLRFLVFSFVTDDSSSKSCHRVGCPDRRITTSRRTHENNTLRRLPLAPSSSRPPRVQAAAAA